MYIKVTNGAYEKPYSIGQLRKDNPRTSFPKNPSEALLAEWGVFPVSPVSQPSVDHTKNVIEKSPVKVNGKWTQAWEVANATAQEIEQRIAEKANAAREQRDTLLSQTDWTQVADAPVDKAAWATYRQALRDIPQQAGFPATIIWPVKP